MSTMKAKKKIKSKTTMEEFMANGKITINDDIKDYSNEPIFVEKAKRAEEFLKKVGLPKQVK